MSAPLVCGIDCGTTGVKAIAFELDGRAAAAGRADITLDNPSPDAWEQNASGWLTALDVALEKLTSSLGTRRSAIRAIAIANQRETFVLADEDGRPRRPAVVWMDKRAKRDVQEAVAELGEDRLHRVTGKPACTTPSFYKARFLRRSEPDAVRGAWLFDVHGFLVRHLTGIARTSLASADPLGLVDLASRAWDPTLADACGLDAERLAELVDVGTDLGPVLTDKLRAWGLDDDVRLIAGAGDGQAAALGAGLGQRSDEGYLNLGTALVGGKLSDSICIDRSFRTLFACGGGYLLESDLLGGMFTLQWMRNLLGEPESAATFAALEHEAKTLAPGEGGLFVPYLHGVMNPFWNDAASGAWIGVRGHAGRGAMFRAIVEGLALEQRLCFDGMQRVAGPITSVRVVGGGAHSRFLLSVFADALSRRLLKTHEVECTALGAAMVAAKGAGFFTDIRAAQAAMASRTDAVAPSPHAPRYEQLYREVYEGLYEALETRMMALGRSTDG